MTPDEFFAGHPIGFAVYERVREAVDGIGPSDVRATKSQVAFSRRRGFAWVWRPQQYLGRGSEAVLSIGLGREDGSPRSKEVAESAPRQWMHHLEVNDPAEIDDQVVAWLREAYDRAG